MHAFTCTLQPNIPPGTTGTCMKKGSYRSCIVSAFAMLFTLTGIFADVVIDDFEQGYNGNRIGTPWYFYTDSSNGGNSTVDNAGPGNQFTGNYGPGNGSTYAGVMEFTLGSAYDYPYTAMGFSFTNSMNAPVDMSGATAITFDIKASRTMDVRVEVGQSTIIDFDYYKKIISAGTTWKTVTILLKSGTGNLQQGGWGDEVDFDITCLDRINWVYQDDYISGTISIDNVVIIGDPVGLQTPPPYPPILSLPPWNAVDQEQALTMVWHKADGATVYQLQMATSDTFKTCFIDVNDLIDTVYPVTGLAKATTWYWRVRAISDVDTGRWSSIGKFTTYYDAPAAPVARIPADGAVGVSLSTPVSWSASIGATTYNLQVSESSSFTLSIIDTTGITDTAHVLSLPANGTKYYWHVSATNLSGTSGWSTIRSFTTIQAPPPVPALVSPANGELDVDTIMTFIWKTSASAASYTLQVSKISTFSTYIVNEPDITDTTIAGIRLGSSTRYYWQVRAVTSDDVSSVSATRNFTTLMVPPSVPAITAPVDGATDVPLTTTIKWGAVSGASSYELNYSTSPDFASALVSKTEILSASYMLTDLSYSTVYHVRVRSVNDAGTSDWSDTINFTTIDLPAATARMSLLGFYTTGPKRIVVKGAFDSLFEVRNSEGTVLFDGKLGTPSVYAPSGETVRIADISSLKSNVAASLYCDGKKATGGDILILSQPLRNLATASIKAFYYQRASTALPSSYAGTWSRAAGHPDTAVFVHSSAGSGKISAPKGWYDAGDYGKYIVNSGITVYTLLALYEHFPEFMTNLSLTIPESDNDVPDILDEVRWNLEWMLSMQATDGGVYSKLTPLYFDEFIMPYESVTKRYVFMKTTAAALDFAAVMAMSSRLYSTFDATFAARCRTAAKKAYGWAVDSPAVAYVQPSGCNTGEYGDTKFSDEFFWASAELALATRSDSYTKHLVTPVPLATIPSWQNVTTLGLYTVLTNMHAFPHEIVDTATARIVATANTLLSRQKQGYGISMASDDFCWGSNHVAASQGVILLYAYYLTGEIKYWNAAQQQLDYLLGRNPYGSSFVTGFGDRSPKYPHHRIFDADGIAAPLPGFLVGGSNPNNEDASSCGSAYADKPATSWLDDVCSYASNEVAINWNAPFAYCAGAMEALYSGDSVSGFTMATTGVINKGILLHNERITLADMGNSFIFNCPFPSGGSQKGVFRMYNVLGKQIMELPITATSLDGTPRYSIKVTSGHIAAGYVLVEIDAGAKRFRRPFILR